MITPAQCRAARALLDWSADRLAAQARLDGAVLTSFEGGGALSPQDEAVLKRVLEEAGAMFLGEGEAANGGPGVRLRQMRRDEGLRPDQLTTENDH